MWILRDDDNQRLLNGVGAQQDFEASLRHTHHLNPPPSASERPLPLIN
jgi:hypothetical protein